ncbi:4a-hydroxytetrahydrobiopterin dehydratase [Loktanella sp. F6476L]|uniref:4a-hydroxytetrahydrobiopterin dehydratase n=1 Tax=Loktanella sp. F6476L TaxID=2926405 RepID=UPI001FF69DC5|nr:4a-hydroxytetrahydrobiopterin dehydratase [Loktanella sp. F6476L]MCK0120993.1 4a-hydroxytetrahydrobiopterin dehydratase [Loktanella sp. F6476L]
MGDLQKKTCAACDGWVPVLTEVEITQLKSQLDPAWEIDLDGQSLSRRFTFKGFAKATYTANLAAFVSDKEGHHADISFGWGYCQVTYTSHELGRLSENDFICAAKLDAVVA